MLGFDLPRTRSLRVAGVVVLCAFAALLVAMAIPSSADAARLRCAATPPPVSASSRP